MEWQDEHVHAALQASGLRATASRLRILYALAHHEDPVTAQALHAELRAGGSPVGLTTVYRALAALLLVGEVHTFRNADELAYRRCGPAPHHHLRCCRCGWIAELRAAVERVVRDLHTDRPFVLADQPVEIVGYCGRCP